MNANAPHLNDAAARDRAAARDTDNTIDRALSALRDAQPRSGLNGRILASLEHRTAAPQPTRFHISAHIALWAATSATIIAVASLLILHHQTTPARSSTSPVILSEAPHSGAQSKDSDIARGATKSELFPTTTVARPTNTASSRPEHRSLAAMRSGETPVLADAQTPHTDGVTPTDAQALADLHAPSHPAPPLPLTPQEKLFLSRLRYGNATQLAELDPIVRVTHDDAAAAAFKAFFPDPPPPHQPGDPDDSN